MADPSVQPMSTIEARLARHFLRRLQHAAEAAAIAHAVKSGILVRADNGITGVHGFGVFERGDLVKGKSETETKRILQRANRRASGQSTSMSDREEISLTMFEAEAWLNGAGGGSQENHQSSGGNSPARELEATGGSSVGVPTAALVRMVRDCAESLRASDVATLLLVAQSIPCSGVSLSDVLSALSFRLPIVTISCEVPGFENSFLDLLKRGMILPGSVSLANGSEVYWRKPLQFSRTQIPKWKVVCFTGQEHNEDHEQVGQAALTDFPILGVTEMPDGLPAHLIAATGLKLDCGTLNAEIVNGTIEAVLGGVPEDRLADEQYRQLDLADLATAIRPGVSPSRAIVILREIVAAKLNAGDDDEAEDETPSRKMSDGKKPTQNSTGNDRRGKDPGSGSEIIQPAKPPADNDEDRFALCVETVSGYGEKLPEWALSLKDDLDLWRAGRIRWEDMVAKLLLSGPPGTGKTQFARVLCNTLGIPLIATSVSTWLEPGYLGDVLKRMSRAFAEAKEHSPCILFIDEIDGIGSRGWSRHNDDYWTSFVNKGLELFDGAIKCSGIVIVGATNNPGIIDKALLRAGRLETHIEIGKPDTSALAGIIRHHLKNDLDAVVASAPERAIRGLRRATGPEAGPKPAASKRKRRRGSRRSAGAARGFTSGGSAT